MNRIVLAMSGGVDSSVAAHLLCEAGHDVVGVFMRHGESSPVACAIDSNQNTPGSLPQLPVVSGRLDHKQGCCSAADAEDARRVADGLGIPFFALNLEKEFGRIMDYFVDEYTVGRTPNPCVQCNNWIKFGKLFDYADSINADFVATGHYAQIRHLSDNTPALVRGLDDTKDQSYALFGIQRKYLTRMMLPVGGFRKSKIRDKAEAFGLNVARKRDSQEICFVTSGHHDQFVQARRGTENTAGEIVTTAGQVVGEHPGIERFTIGQRKGLGVALGEPQYVVRIEADTRRVVIGDHDELAATRLTASQLNWLVDPPTQPLKCLAQIRYNSQAQPATVTLQGEDQLLVQFDKPQHGVAPGQAVVIYQDDRILGGGWIDG